MFHFTPHYSNYSSPEVLPYTYVDSPMTYDSAYDAYDNRRSRLEQIALARRQQERRAAEEAAWRRRAALEAAIEEQEVRHRQEQLYRQRRARELQLARERQEAAAALALEEEYRRRKIAQRQRQLELQERQQQQEYLRQRAQAQAQAQAGAVTTDAELHPLESLLRAFFGQAQDCNESVKEKEPEVATSSHPQQQTTPSSAPAATKPEVAVKDTPVEQPASDEAANDADYESSAAEEDAASTLQRHYRTHLHRREALSTLSSLADSLRAQQSSFTLPEHLTFQPSPPSSTTDDATNEAAPTSTTPRLAFSPSNAPLLAYEDFLVRLLSKIDAISSGGDRTIKRARKDLVKAVNDELARLDAARDRAWSEQQQKQQQRQQSDEPAVQIKATEMTEAVEPHVQPTETEDVSSTSAVSAADASEPTDDATVFATPSPTAAPEDVTENNEADGEDEDDGHDSDSTLSVDSVEVNVAVDDIVRQAHKLGERVEKLERAEMQSQGEDEQFVMV